MLPSQVAGTHLFISVEKENNYVKQFKILAKETSTPGSMGWGGGLPITDDMYIWRDR